MLDLQDAGIYLDSGTNPFNACEYHFSQLTPENNYNKLGTYYYQSSLNDFIETQHPIKIAGYHVSFPAVDTWLERFDKVYPFVIHSFVFCSEVHQVTVEQLNQVDRTNVTIYIAGKFNYTLKFAKVRTWLDWFVTSTNFYKNINPNLLKTKLIDVEHKSKKFDILLGCRRDHRTFVHNYIITNNLQFNNIVTYHQKWSQDLRLSDQYITEDDGVEYTVPPNHTVQYVKYYGAHISMSQIVPIKIYNQTHYSLVAETNATNEFNFYTEKIVKPILARRLFIAIAGQYYLKNLRGFGFRTFSNVIDESYDEEPNHELRWQMAMDQLQYLCNQDPQEILPQIKNIVNHNQRLMLDNDWYDDFKQDFLKDIVHTIGR